jgi:VWFA-related protein
VKAAAIIGLLGLLGAASAGQQPRFTSSTSLVRLEVSVTDDQGPVRGLGRDAFTVEDGGVRQTVQVEEAADAPLDLVLVAPPLASVAYTSADQTARVAAGVSAFLGHVRGSDRLGVVTAGAPPTLLRPMESGRPSFELRAFGDGSDSAPLDAMAAALRVFVASDRRRALVGFTNAADFRSVVTLEILEAMARRLGPAFVLVGTMVKIETPYAATAITTTGIPMGPEANGVISGYVFPVTLEVLARRTGGMTVNLSSGNPAELIAHMFTWLRTQYLVSYEPPPGKGWHPVSVSVNHLGAKVTVREGYFVD